MLGNGRECPNTSDGQHNIEREKRTLADGKQKTVVYCTSCGMEK